MYNLGKNLHTRYYRLLPKDGMYSKEEIMVQSSYAERCLMSAQSFMAGFMPPLENRNPLPVPWQPIPIRSLPRTQDYVSFVIHFLVGIIAEPFPILLPVARPEDALQEVRRDAKEPL